MADDDKIRLEGDVSGFVGPMKEAQAALEETKRATEELAGADDLMVKAFEQGIISTEVLEAGQKALAGATKESTEAEKAQANQWSGLTIPQLLKLAEAQERETEALPAATVRYPTRTRRSACRESRTRLYGRGD